MAAHAERLRRFHSVFGAVPEQTRGKLEPGARHKRIAFRLVERHDGSDDGAVGSAHPSMTAITFLDLFFDHGSPYKGAASCFHPRKAHDHRDGERYDQLLSRASAHRFSGIRRTADAGRETPSALFANVSRTLGPLRRRECRHGSILFGDLRSKSPSRRDWDSRDNGRGAWVFWAFIISLSWSQQQ